MVSTPASYYRISSAVRPPLRVGLLLDSRDETSAFFARNIEEIKASNFTKIELLVVKRNTPKGALSDKSTTSGAPRFLRRLLDPKLRKYLLYDFYLRLDRRMKPANDPLAKVNCGDMLSGIETLEVQPETKKFIHRFPPDALEKIRSKDLDVLIRFGFN